VSARPDWFAWRRARYLSFLGFLIASETMAFAALAAAPPTPLATIGTTTSVTMPLCSIGRWLAVDLGLLWRSVTVKSWQSGRR
jgi:hypothetical protein